MENDIELKINPFDDRETFIPFRKRTNFTKSSTTKKGKNEKDLNSDNYYDGANGLRSAPGPDI
jgi:hypothetical protein